MVGIITKIHPEKLSRNEKTTYIRVEFKLSDGRWAKTDICPQYRNYSNWVDNLVEGRLLGQLMMKADNEVNADSKPVCLTS